jgi:hypothetical protein
MNEGNKLKNVFLTLFDFVFLSLSIGSYFEIFSQYLIKFNKLDFYLTKDEKEKLIK